MGSWRLFFLGGQHSLCQKFSFFGRTFWVLYEVFHCFFRHVNNAIVPQVKDQQEAERKKVTSQEIQVALTEQTKVIAEKQNSVREDLAGVEPAVIEAQNGMFSFLYGY